MGDGAVNNNQLSSLFIRYMFRKLKIYIWLFNINMYTLIVGK